MKLLVRNIDRGVTETQLQSLFEAYGTIQSCTIVLDQKTGGSKGFGFVEMPKPGEAKAAVKNLNGKNIQGSELRVKKAEKKSAVSPESSKPNLYNKLK
ncbi:MAG: RNA-binding protein [Gammaproteobacteria bacterium]|nr:RNA-binding protein [Gammaproteobacteria bacterium]